MSDDANSYGAHADVGRSAGFVPTTTADETVPDDRSSHSVDSTNTDRPTTVAVGTVEAAR